MYRHSIEFWDKEEGTLRKSSLKQSCYIYSQNIFVGDREVRGINLQYIYLYNIYIYRYDTIIYIIYNIYTISTQVISGAGVEALSANCQMECCTTAAEQMTEAAACD